MIKTKAYTLDELLYRLTNFILVGSLLCILAIVLFPYDFFFRPTLKETYDRFIMLWLELPFFTDLSLNIILFLPFGFGLGCLFRKRKKSGKLFPSLLAITGLSFSFILEMLQTLLPSRLPSIIDILMNGFGTLIGGIIFQLWGLRILRAINGLLAKIKIWLSPKRSLILFIIYMGLTLLLSGYLQITIRAITKLSNWDVNFPLVIGNEYSGDRPWNGYIFEIFMTDHAINANELKQVFSNRMPCAQRVENLIASYCFINGQVFNDRIGSLPSFKWQGNASPTASGRGVLVNQQSWLETNEPATGLAEKIKATSEFTILAYIATNEINQTGPARIFSNSKDPYHRNFTIAQEGADLVFRTRTPFSGLNGSSPQFIARNVLNDRALHKIVLTYKNNSLKLYIDGEQYPRFLQITPGALFFSYFGSLFFFDMIGYSLVFYGVIFIPLCLFLVSLMNSLTKKNQKYITCGIGILLPALTYPLVWSFLGKQTVNFKNIGVCLGLMASFVFLFQFLLYPAGSYKNRRPT